MASNDEIGREAKIRAQIAALVEGEGRLLAERKRRLDNCDCKEGMFPNFGRRGLLFAVGSALAAAAAPGAPPAAAEEQKHPAPPGRSPTSLIPSGPSVRWIYRDLVDRI